MLRVVVNSKGSFVFSLYCVVLGSVLATNAPTNEAGTVVIVTEPSMSTDPVAS